MTASVSGLGTTFNLPNYTGELFQLGLSTTPFLNLIGGINGANARKVQSTEFALNQNWKTNEASQPKISEKAAADGKGATAYKRGQETNVVQIFQEAIDITYSKLGNSNAHEGINVYGEPVMQQNELDFQIMAHLKQIALDSNYTFLKGAYAAATDESTAAQSRGIVTAIESKVVTNSSETELTKDMVDELVRNAATDGFDFTNAVFFADAYNKQMLTKLFGLAPQDRTIGGLNINQIETDFGRIMVVFEPLMKGTLGLFDMNKIRPVLREIPTKGIGVFYEPLAKTGASEKGQLYGEMGLDYGSEAFHGKITNLTTAPSL